MKTVSRVGVSLASACFLLAHPVAGQAALLSITNDFTATTLAYNGNQPYAKRTVTTAFPGAQNLCATDLNRDGNMDLLGCSQTGSNMSEAGGRVAWWENRGAGTGWVTHAISGNLKQVYTVAAADLNGDTHMDVVASVYYADDLIWWRNNGGAGTNWTERVIDANFSRPYGVGTGDLNGDGRMDVFAGSTAGDQIAWWQNNTGAGTNWTRRIVDASFDQPYGLGAADVDGDGDLDLFGTAFSGDMIAWWENANGAGTAWTRHVVTDTFSYASAAACADMDGDGDVDFAAASSIANTIAWWENTDGFATTWTLHTVDTQYRGARDIVARDLDADGDVDLVAPATTDNDLAWWENLNRSGTAWVRRTLDANFTGASGVCVADVNADGELDVAATGASTTTRAGAIAWWRNPATNRYLFLPPTDTQTVPDAANAFISVRASPLFSGDTQRVCRGWVGSGSIPSSGSATAIGPLALTLDSTLRWTWQTQYRLSLAARSNGTVNAEGGWYADGASVELWATPATMYVFDRWEGDLDPGVTNLNPVAVTMDRGRRVTAVFREVDNVVVSSAGPHGSIYPTGTQGVEHAESLTYTMVPDPHYHVDAVYVDGSHVGNAKTYTFLSVTNDHAIRVTFAANAYTLTVSNRFAVSHAIENGSPGFDPPVTVAADPLSFTSLALADLDGDGAEDLVCVRDVTRELVWYRRLDPSGYNWNAQLLLTNAPGLTALLSADIDSDGDMDLATYSTVSNALYWMENLDGSATNWHARPLDTSGQMLTALAADDFNGDGRMDLAGVSSAPGQITIWLQPADTSDWQSVDVNNTSWGVSALAVGRLDTNSAPDLVTASPSDLTLRWWSNAAGDGLNWQPHDIGSGGHAIVQVALADFDGDGDTDVAGADSGSFAVFWWRNDGTGEGWQETRVADGVPSPADLVAADLDRDGDLDLAGTSVGASILYWCENLDGRGQSWQMRTVDGFLPSSARLAVSDMNGDSEPDIVGTAGLYRPLAWWPNRPLSRRMLTPPADSVTYLYGTSIRCVLTNGVLATPAVRSRCTGWRATGSAPSSGTGLQTAPFTLAADTAITWLWQTEYPLTVHADTNGLVDPPSGWYPEGALALWAYPSNGYAFAGWTGDVPPAERFENPGRLTLDAARTVRVDFVAGDFVILAESPAGALLSPSGLVGVAIGANVPFRFATGPGTCVGALLVDGERLPPDDRYTFFNVIANHRLGAELAPETPETDTDGDHLPNVEEYTAGSSAYDRDTDDDGADDLHEAIAGTVPTNAASRLVTSVAVGADFRSVVVRWPTVTNRTYSLLFLPQAPTGDWSTVAGQTNLPGTGAVRAYTNDAPSPTGFYRARARRP